MATIKIKAVAQGGVTQVRCLINHPMETGLRKDSKTGQLIPAHYIQELIAEHNGQQVLVMHMGTAVAKNPYLSFRFSGGNKGDKIKVSWVDNQGNRDSTEATVG